MESWDASNLGTMTGDSVQGLKGYALKGELGCQQPGHYSGGSIQGLNEYALKGEMVGQQPGHYSGDSIQGLKWICSKKRAGLPATWALFR